eukprot:4990536-Amphidinium_carterae.1
MAGESQQACSGSRRRGRHHRQTITKWTGAQHARCGVDSGLAGQLGGRSCILPAQDYDTAVRGPVHQALDVQIFAACVDDGRCGRLLLPSEVAFLCLPNKLRGPSAGQSCLGAGVV